MNASPNSRTDSATLGPAHDHGSITARFLIESRNLGISTMRESLLDLNYLKSRSRKENFIAVSVRCADKYISQTQTWRFRYIIPVLTAHLVPLTAKTQFTGASRMVKQRLNIVNESVCSPLVDEFSGRLQNWLCVIV